MAMPKFTIFSEIKSLTLFCASKNSTLAPVIVPRNPGTFKINLIRLFCWVIINLPQLPNQMPHKFDPLVICPDKNDLPLVTCNQKLWPRLSLWLREIYCGVIQIFECTWLGGVSFLGQVKVFEGATNPAGQMNANLF